MTCVYQAKFEFKDSSIQPKYFLICCLKAPAIANARDNSFLKDRNFYQQLPIYHVEQNLVHLGRFMHFSQKSGWSDIKNSLFERRFSWLENQDKQSVVEIWFVR